MTVRATLMLRTLNNQFGVKIGRPSLAAIEEIIMIEALKKIGEKN